jgi:hypothetical protein
MNSLSNLKISTYVKPMCLLILCGECEIEMLPRFKVLPISKSKAVFLPIELDVWENRVLCYHYYKINVRAAGKENYLKEEVPGT